ncbi:MAG: hypothetical protein V1735_00015 [Nanoarchaeota archaeon]
MYTLYTMRQNQKMENEDKSTTVRLNESTRQLLASVAVGQESFNDTIRRLVSTYKNLNETGPQIVKKNNVVGTAYERMRRTFTPYGHFDYDVTCSFNDVRAISAFRLNKSLYEALNTNVRGSTEWTLDLEILEIKKIDSQKVEHDNQKIDERFKTLVYFIILERIFKEILQIPTYGFITEKDFLSWDKWKEFYTSNNLSEESFSKDVEKKLRDLEFDG